MTVREQQCILLLLGYEPGGVDGIAGAKTKAALAAFAAEHPDCFTEFDGSDDAALLAALHGWEPSGGSQKGQSGTWWKEIQYFRREEFRCPCGKCGGFPAEPWEKLVRLEDGVRKHFGVPITNSSGVRCPEHNARVGGVYNSRHLSGQAVDFSVAGKSANEVLAYVRQQPETAYCYAIDGSFVHMDVV